MILKIEPIKELEKEPVLDFPYFLTGFLPVFPGFTRPVPCPILSSIG